MLGIHCEWHIELRALGRRDAVRDDIIAIEGFHTFREAIQVELEIGAIDEVGVGGIDQHLATITAWEVEPATAGRRVELAHGAVILRATIDSAVDRMLLHAGKLGDLQASTRAGAIHRVDRPVEVFPVHRAQWVAGVQAATTIVRAPNTAVIPNDDILRRILSNRDRVIVGVQAPADINPAGAAIGRAEDTA